MAIIQCSTCRHWQVQLSPEGFYGEPYSLDYCTGCIYFGKSDKYEPIGKPKKKLCIKAGKNEQTTKKKTTR